MREKKKITWKRVHNAINFAKQKSRLQEINGFELNIVCSTWFRKELERSPISQSRAQGFSDGLTEKINKEGLTGIVNNDFLSITRNDSH